MVTFTEQDILSYKAALARYAAKDKFLVEKYQKCIATLKAYMDDVVSQKSSVYRDAVIEKCEFGLMHLNSFLKDLQTPADQFISDFEFRSCK